MANRRIHRGHGGAGDAGGGAAGSRTGMVAGAAEMAWKNAGGDSCEPAAGPAAGGDGFGLAQVVRSTRPVRELALGIVRD